MLVPLLTRRRFAARETIFRQGDPAEALFLLTSGQVTIALASPHGAPKRLSTLSAGMSFGELALVIGGQRSADVVATSAVDCWELDRAAFDRLGASHPQVKIALLQNMLRSAHEIVARLSREVTALAA